MKTKKETKEIIDILRKTYPEAEGSLDFNNPFQMAVAVLLSAQTTDARVNIVTKDLFKAAPNAEKMNELSLEEVTKYIKSVGLYKTKARNIKKMASQIVNEHGGIVPSTMEELQNLAGIGRKSANVVMLEAFSNPQGIAVDTHAKRISNRLGLSNENDPNKIEKDLLKRVSKEDYYDANHLFVWHGRYTCKARKPECSKCPLTEYCKYYKKENKVGKYKIK